MSVKKKAAMLLGVAVISAGAFASPAMAFGHGIVPAGTCAQSGQAVDNPTAEKNNPFTDSNPIPAKSGKSKGAERCS